MNRQKAHATGRKETEVPFTHMLIYPNRELHRLENFEEEKRIHHTKASSLSRVPQAINSVRSKYHTAYHV